MEETVTTARPPAPPPKAGTESPAESDAAPFWTFSLDLYARPGVAAACLALQDGFGADVNLVLFGAWLGRRGVVLDADRLGLARGVAGTWQAAVVGPLRDVRRHLKPSPDAAAQALRGTVKAAELEAERLEQAALQALAQGWAPGGPAAVEANLRAVLPAADALPLLGRIAAAAQAVPHG